MGDEIRKPHNHLTWAYLNTFLWNSCASCRGQIGAGLHSTVAVLITSQSSEVFRLAASQPRAFWGTRVAFLQLVHRLYMELVWIKSYISIGSFCRVIPEIGIRMFARFKYITARFPLSSTFFLKAISLYSLLYYTYITEIVITPHSIHHVSLFLRFLSPHHHAPKQQRLYRSCWWVIRQVRRTIYLLVDHVIPAVSNRRIQAPPNLRQLQARPLTTVHSRSNGS